MKTVNKLTPDVAFLGVCERAIETNQGNLDYSQHTLVDLRKTIQSYIYPLNLGKFFFVIAAYDPINFEPARIQLISPKGDRIADLKFVIETNINSDGFVLTSKNELIDVNNYPQFWPIFVSKIVKDIPIVIEPCTYKVMLIRDSIEIQIGVLNFGFIEAPPLTEDRIAAIKSSLRGAKYVKLSIGCNKCNDEITVYTGITKDQKLEEKGSLWYEDVPDYYQCKCKKNNLI